VNEEWWHSHHRYALTTLPLFDGDLCLCRLCLKQVWLLKRLCFEPREAYTRPKPRPKPAGPPPLRHFIQRIKDKDLRKLAREFHELKGCG
jgi:hypothetical protein